MKKQNAKTQKRKDAKIDTQQQAWAQRLALAHPWASQKKSLCILASLHLCVLLFSIVCRAAKMALSLVMIIMGTFVASLPDVVQIRFQRNQWFRLECSLVIFSGCDVRRQRTPFPGWRE
jgi:hypothetical protein